jgi:hypothetical protein
MHGRDPVPKAPARSTELAPSIPCYLSFSRDSRDLAMSRNNGSVEVLDVAAQRLRCSIPGEDDWPPRGLRCGPMAVCLLREATGAL